MALVWLRQCRDHLVSVYFTLGSQCHRLVHLAAAPYGLSARFWQRWAGAPMNEHQTKVLNRVLDGSEGKLTSKKWAALCKCSLDTALRDINELIILGVLTKAAGKAHSRAC